MVDIPSIALPFITSITYIILIVALTRLPGVGVKRGLSLGGYFLAFITLLLFQSTGILAGLTIETHIIIGFLVLSGVISVLIGRIYPQIYLGSLSSFVRFITEFGILLGIVSILATILVVVL